MNTTASNTSLLSVLREQKEMQLKGGIYHKVQIELTYNSNHIEGNRLTHDQTRYIFETNTIGATDSAALSAYIPFRTATGAWAAS